MDHPFRILFISNYPSNTRPSYHVFVHVLLRELANLGAEVTVVAPEPWWNITKAQYQNRLGGRLEQREGVTVHRPRYLPFSRIPLPIGGTTFRLTVNAYAKAVINEVMSIKPEFDLCMAHFLYPQGFAAAQIAAKLQLPAVISLGESTFARYETTYRTEEISQLLHTFAGVITNSSWLKNQCVDHYSVPEEKVQVFPNGVDETRFYPHDRRWARNYCQLPEDQPIVISVGHLTERKGPLRTMTALRDHPEIGAVFLGTGPQVPSGAQVLFQGEVPHDDVPIWLSAADAFVLPTSDEGCSNAVLEALSCGLPIISADRPFNHDILNDEVALLVDPYDTQALSGAIATLFATAENRMAMSDAALQHASAFRVRNRAAKILSLLQSIAKPTPSEIRKFTAVPTPA